MKDLFDGEDFLKLKGEKKALHHKTLRRQTAVEVLEVQDEWRRAYGVQQLIKVMGVGRPEPGKSYHIISGGNVDLLSHLRWLLCHWERFESVFISAWAISAADILLLDRWAKRGSIANVRLLVGDVFPRKYVKEWDKLTQMYNDGVIKRLYSDTIHSKLMLLKASDGTFVVLESSANCNMNLRVEQTVVTISDGLYRFYVDYFDELFLKTMDKRVVRDFEKMELYTEMEDIE